MESENLSPNQKDSDEERRQKPTFEELWAIPAFRAIAEWYKPEGVAP